MDVVDVNELSGSSPPLPPLSHALRQCCQSMVKTLLSHPKTDLMCTHLRAKQTPLYNAMLISDDRSMLALIINHHRFDINQVSILFHIFMIFFT